MDADDSSTIEKETLGFDHTELGGWVTERWRLPSALVKAVRWHHEPGGAADDKQEVDRLVAIVHAANILSRGGEDADADSLVDLLVRRADPDVLKALPLASRTMLGDLIPFVASGIDLARQLFSEPLSAGAGTDAVG